MAKRNKSTTIRNIVIVAVVLIAAQIVFQLMVKKEAPVTIREALQKQADAMQDLGHREKEIFRITLAIQQYIESNQGSPPADLRALTPTYFDTVPVDPDTGEEFVYQVIENRPCLAEQCEAASGVVPVKAGGGGRKGGKDSSEDATPKDQQEALIATLDQDDSEQLAMVYDPSGKRDPFRPFNFAPEPSPDPNKTELERYAIGQLRLTAVLEDESDPKAIVENSAGRGFTVRKGSKIGVNSGEVIEIHPDRLLILETKTDFTGEKTTQTVELKLRTESEEAVR